MSSQTEWPPNGHTPDLTITLQSNLELQKNVKVRIIFDNKIDDSLYACSIYLEQVTFKGEHIGHRAFAQCFNLNNISMPNVINIGFEAFQSCSVEHIILPDSLETIGEGVFSYSSLHDLTLPEQITKIPSRAFEHCTHLTTVNLPEGITHIADDAFSECPALASIVIHSTNKDEFDRIVNLLPQHLQGKASQSNNESKQDNPSEVTESSNQKPNQPINMFVLGGFILAVGAAIVALAFIGTLGTAGAVVASLGAGALVYGLFKTCNKPKNHPNEINAYDESYYNHHINGTYA